MKIPSAQIFFSSCPLPFSASSKAAPSIVPKLLDTKAAPPKPFYNHPIFSPPDGKTMVELIISEKPSSARKIAEALADGKLIQHKKKLSSYFELTHNRKPLIVTSAVGHLFTLTEIKKNGWTYPVFDIQWVPADKVVKASRHVREFIDTIHSLAARADEFTIACDYDIEGEVIGLNAIRFVCGRQDASRMKFSTLTKPDLVEAYEHKMPHLDWGQANAGDTRHRLDWFYGINLSRALTASVKAAGAFKLMSIGRVQGPALKILAEREREIRAFRPEPYWEIHLAGEYRGEAVEARHVKDKIFSKAEAEKIMQKVAGQQEATIKEVRRNRREQMPPAPFDLTTLQSEAYNLFKITPKDTLALAQNLYLAGLTSYPRTSSQQLDPKLGFAKILQQLSSQAAYRELCRELLALDTNRGLKPNNGKKTDPAHPAIYPTGLVPKGLKEREQKIYDLIVKRFMATFAAPAVRETMEVFLDVNAELFLAKGTRTVEENWHRYYRPYVKLEEVALPNMREREKVAVKKISKVDKETQPPKRYNQSSIIKELEKKNLGTKATRADILERLFQRGYIEGVQIQVTGLGMETIALLEKHAPTIIDEKLTAHFEEDMEKIREGQEKPAQVLEEAKKYLSSLLEQFRKKEKAIGEDILKSLQETREEQNYIGECPACKSGKLTVKKGKFGRFIACGRYPDCTATFNVPNAGTLKRTEKICEHCRHPIVKMIQRRRAQETCLNQNCPGKTSTEEKKELRQIEQGKMELKCPKCGKELVVRKSVYGTFLGCAGYPKCRHTRKLGVDSGVGGGAESRGNKSPAIKRAKMQ